MSATRAQYVVDDQGKKKGVILPVTRYRRLLEDLHDLAVVAERRKEAPISHAELKRRMKTRVRRKTLVGR